MLPLSKLILHGMYAPGAGGCSNKQKKTWNASTQLWMVNLLLPISGPRDAQRDKSKQAKRSLTTLRESSRAEKWSGNERYIDICEYERDTKQEGIPKKRSKWCFSAFMQQSPGHSATAEQEKQGAHRS